MKPRPTRLLPAALVPLFLACAAAGSLRQEGRRPLDHDAYARWRTIADAELSFAGAWLAYRLEPADGADGELVVRATSGPGEHRVARGERARIDHGERFLAAIVAPERDALRAAKKAKKKKDELPVDGLALVDLATGERVDVERVRSFAMPEERGGWIAYLHLEPPKEKKGKGKDEEEAAREEPAGEPPGPEPEPEPEPVPEEPEEPESKAAAKKKEEKKDGTVLVLRRLATGEERRYERARLYAFSTDGRWLAYTTSTEDGSNDGVHLVEVDTGEARTPLAGEGRYAGLAFDEAGRRLAFLSDRDDWAADEPDWTLFLADTESPESPENMEGPDEARAIARAGTEGVPSGWGVGRHRDPHFSETGRRLYFGTAPRPEPEPEELPEDERVTVDVWSWTDDLIQPMQLARLERERERSYLAVAHLDEGGAARVVQLANREYPDVAVQDEGELDVALATSDLPYRRMMSWDTQTFEDVALVDVETGRRRTLLERERGSFALSPGGGWVTWWDPERTGWFALSAAGGRPVELGAGIPWPLDDQLHDTPALPRSYGSGGWLADDAGFLIHDEHDVWLVDPRAPESPRCLTEGVGRREGMRFRVVDLDREEEALDPAEPLLLSAFHLRTKESGFYRDAVAGAAEPRRLVWMARDFSTPVRAEEGGLVRFTRESFEEFPDLWVAKEDFADARRLSDANPQQAEYLWGTAELVEWTSTEGAPLQGILYEPEGFDPGRQYPLIAYFYERSSDRLHSHADPIPSRSTIKFSFYTSRGYLVFVPDIPYRVGWPGESAMHAVLPGILSLVDAGFVDPDAIGLQGHSWGGYQVAYMVTRSPLFAAAVSGAPVANMTSAYGGIRWGTGMSRMFQYEKTQSRIGGTLWEAPQRYVDNSPVFFADQVRTPLLILHNDDDGAVPWYQGIELFVALRRLGKPAWMLNYNGEKHGITKYAHKRDYAVRMQQFFDHYLRGAPAPVWMVDGVPALEKGRSLGLDLVTGTEPPARATEAEAP